MSGDSCRGTDCALLSRRYRGEVDSSRRDDGALLRREPRGGRRRASLEPVKNVGNVAAMERERKRKGNGKGMRGKGLDAAGSTAAREPTDGDRGKRCCCLGFLAKEICVVFFFFLGSESRQQRMARERARRETDRGGCRSRTL